MKCASCDHKITAHDALYLDGIGDVCNDCYYDESFECVLCEERQGEKLKSDFVLFKSELQNPPGVYVVLSYPFLLCPVIGAQSVLRYDVAFVDKLPEPDATYEMSGPICPHCARPYEKTLLRGYKRSRRWLAHHCFERVNGTADLERTWMRHIILKNPDMLLDMEVDPEDEEWTDLKEHLHLPDLRTYRDWLFLEYKGVKVYSVYRHGSGGWLCMSPLPKYRGRTWGEHGVFDVTSLPTWRRGLYGYQYEHPEQDREALIIAIDRGLLTPTGLRL